MKEMCFIFLIPINPLNLPNMSYFTFFLNLFEFWKISKSFEIIQTNSK
jgi:hypothetical protein